VHTGLGRLSPADGCSLQVKVDIAGAEEKGWNFTRVILGCMAVFGLVTIGVLVAMAVSPDCGCGTQCPAAQQVIFVRD
jgi:hypothetical protein